LTVAEASYLYFCGVGQILGVEWGTEGAEERRRSNIVFVSAEVLTFGCSIVRWDEYQRRGKFVQLSGETAYFSLKEQNCWFITCHTISSEAMVVAQLIFLIDWCLLQEFSGGLLRWFLGLIAEN